MCLSLYVVWNSYRVGKNSRTSEIRGMLVSRLVCLGSRFGWLVWRLLPFGAQTVVNHPLLLSDRSPRLAFCLFSVTHFSFWIDLCMYVTAPLQPTCSIIIPATVALRAMRFHCSIRKGQPNSI